MPVPELTYASLSDWPALRDRLAGRAGEENKVEDKVVAILEDVRKRGDEALVDYTRRFDCPDFQASSLLVEESEMAHALRFVPGEDMDLIREAAENIRAFHQRQADKSWWMGADKGSLLGQMNTAVDRVGLYVPGGQGGETPLISTILMNVIPARVAGVGEIVMATPPTRQGGLNPYLLATAKLLGVDRVLRLGSAWAVAALAFGTETVPACDVIAGPGNIFVATAKRLLVGKVGIDMVAGPSEILVLADSSARPDWIAADMLSQAEHDPLAAAWLATQDKDLAGAVKEELAAQLDQLPRSGIAARSLADWGAVILAPDMDACLELSNLMAPEHLELAVEDPWSLMPRVRHAGAIFLGHHSPEPVGDYFAGPNHVLPTLGNARFSQALSVADFAKNSSVIATTREYVREHGPKIARLARLEGLEAHARSVEIRYKK